MKKEQNKMQGYRKKRKFIAIEIDGLSYPALLYAMKKGHARFIKKLLKKQGYSLTYYNCSCPSNTAVCQADIIYGDSTGIPGYRWLDKKNRRYISSGRINDANMLEKTAFRGKKGIMNDGSSYSNTFTGGAKKSLFTISAFRNENIAKKVVSTLLYVMPKIRSFARILYYSTTEFLLEVTTATTRKVNSIFSGRYAVFDIRTPFLRLILDGIAKETITLSIMEDFRKGVPRIYATFAGYDEMSHAGGPYSYTAMRSLGHIINSIRRIYKHLPDDYDFYILSDHGASPSMPFDVMSEVKIKDLLEKSAGGEAIIMDFESKKQPRLASIGKKTIELGKLLTKPLDVAIKILASLFKTAFVGGKPIRNWDDKKKIFFEASGGMGFVYFNYKKSKVTISEIMKRYPKMIWNLINHPAIGFVVGNEKNKTVMISKKGRVHISPTGTYKVYGINELPRFGDTEMIIKQISRMMRKNGVGDLVIISNMIKGRVVSFEDQVGSHGSIGGEQTLPVFISKKHHPELKRSEDSRAVHKILSRY